MKGFENDYYIGLDIGTNSVGWAATDTSYDLIRMRGKDLWGTYLFDEAATAAERRSYRTARRRTERSHQRLMLLQGLFAEEVEKVDPLFFIRLNNSSLFADDKDERLHTDDCLFADDNYRDADFYKEYPTIYHLRKAMAEREIKDVRLLYLAVHHIIKRRGHFLFEGQSLSATGPEAVKEKLSEINAYLTENELSALEFARVDDVLGVLSDTRISKSAKSAKIREILNVDKKDKCGKAIADAVCGLKFKLKDIYNPEDDYDADGYTFDTADFEDEIFPKIAETVGDDAAALILSMKAVYDWMMLCNVMKGYAFISDAKIDTYEKHKNDLSALRDHVRQNFPEKYSLVFRKTKGAANYAAYVGSDKGKGFKRCRKADFYDFIKKNVPGSDYIAEEIEKGTFMPLLASSDNGVIPYQTHLAELEAILDNAEKYFPFLKKTKDGRTVREKIEMLMTFRIPYYVGPLCADSKFAWVQRRAGYEKTAITPWNFDEAVDRDASEDRFIGRMTSKCTYLKDQDVLPMSSLLYSEYMFRNELNNLKVNGVKDASVRDIIYDFALGHKKVTLKACLSLLKREGLLPQDATVDVFSGTDGDFTTSLAPFVDLAFLGDKLYRNREMCEEIIKWITIISDKTRLEKRIREKYGKILTSDEIKRLKGLNYTKWGRYSKELLDGIKNIDSGDGVTIIEAMRASTANFMEIFYGGGFDMVVEERNRDFVSDGVTYKVVQELYCSPSVKRSIWRSIMLVKEIVKICGHAPKKIFIEMGRAVNDDARKGKRTISRKQQILDLYRDIKNGERDWKSEIDSTPDSKFDSDRLVLYYMQMGRSMYSGKPISLEDVFNTNICDIDHIYPQSKIKDDSLDNRVLVYKTENMKKLDVYPISSEIRTEMADFWLQLKNAGYISAKKYERLTRRDGLTQSEMEEFINRQLTFTFQSTKAVAETMKLLLGKDGTEVVYAKAANANEFKQRYGIIKIRDLNDLHHAKDAYVNIVVGNVYNTVFGHDAGVYFREHSVPSYNLTKLYDSDIRGAWTLSDVGKIVKTAEKNTCNIVRMTGSGHGKMFDVNLKIGGKGEIPVKDCSPYTNLERYGGYEGSSTAYFMVVKSEGKRGKSKLSLIPYLLHMEKRYHGDMERKVQYCTDEWGLVNPQVVLDYVKINSLIYKNGVYAYLKGYSVGSILLCNANELFLDKKYVVTLKKVSNYMSDRKKFNNKNLAVKDDLSSDDILALYDELAAKLKNVFGNLWIKSDYSQMLKEKRDDFASLSKEKQCETIFEILKFMQCNSDTSDLSVFGEGSNLGKIRINNDITSLGMKIIYQSPTGYYTHVIDTGDFL